MFINGSNNVIGGTAPGARNVISGNNFGVGLSVSAGQVNGNRVQGNFIGTDITGTTALGNNIGVSLFASFGNTIGGTETGAGNVISGNNRAVQIQGGSTGNFVEGNFIGTDETGSLDLGNVLSGVDIFGENPNNTIGGMGRGAGNIIAYNGNAGVAVRGATSTGNAILSNAIFANVPNTGDTQGLGIDLSLAPFTRNIDGLTLNDIGDGDTGPNNLQNFPVVTSATTSGVEGTLNSTPNTIFRLEFFANSTCDLSGFGEGETFLGSTSAATDNTGNTNFTAIFSFSVPLGVFVTATATDPDNNTSEFSACSSSGLSLAAIDAIADAGLNLEDLPPNVTHALSTASDAGLLDVVEPTTASNNNFDLAPDGALVLGTQSEINGDVQGSLSNTVLVGTGAVVKGNINGIGAVVYASDSTQEGNLAGVGTITFLEGATVLVKGDVEVDNLVIEPGAQVTIEGNLDISQLVISENAIVTVNGNVTCPQGATATIDGMLNIDGNDECSAI